MSGLETIERLREATAAAVADRRADLDAGREVVGYFTPLAPPAELIEAAGARPFRLVASGGPDADVRGMGILGRDTCSFCRAVLGAAVTDPPPVSMLVVGSACDRLRRAGDAWPSSTGLPAFHLSCPRTRGLPEEALAMADELRLFARELSARTGFEVTDGRLAAAIRRGNRCRAILRAADEARRGASPRLTGSEFLDVVRAYHGLASRRFLNLAEGLPDEIEARGPVRTDPVRVLLVGPTVLDGRREVPALIEGTGAAVIAADLTDSGTLGYGPDVPPGNPPFPALAMQVLDHPVLAAPLRPSTALRDLYRRTVDEVRPDGVLFRGVPFCRPWNTESQPLRGMRDLPFLDVSEDARGGQGQLRTRVEAFVETLSRRRARR